MPAYLYSIMTATLKKTGIDDPGYNKEVLKPFVSLVSFVVFFLFNAA